MKTLLTLLLIAISPALSSAQLLHTKPAPQKTPVKLFQVDGYAAKVNNKVITRGEVRDAMEPYIPELVQKFKGREFEEEFKQLFMKVRTELIEQRLILNVFDERGGIIPDQYINDEVKRTIKRQFNGDKARFHQSLTAQNQTIDEYKAHLAEEIAVGMMMNQEVSSRTRITPEQIRTYYTNNQGLYFIPQKVKHSVIVLNKGKTEDDQVTKLAEATEIRKQLIEGADFEKTATQVSEGSRASEGGSFPWMQPKDARKELQPALNQLPSGEISDVIETENQFYIIKINARRHENHKAFSEVRADIKKILYDQERSRLKKRWLDRLRKKSYIKLFDA